MPVDTNLLDSAVGLLHLQQTDVQFLGAMAQPATYYVLESDRPWPGGQAKLLRRAALTESVLQECVFDPSLRHAWKTG